MKNKVYFIGAGPGDPDLITVKGRKIIENADVIIYAGSLVSKEHFNYCKDGVELYNSASMTLDQVIDVIKKACREDKKVVRLHTGDPSIYGAIKEQMDRLSEAEIDYEVVPGVSSFTAAAASIKREFTLPGVSQTVILTRIAGRTPVPENEDLEKLASIGCSMALFLSVGMIDKVVEKLRRGYKRNVPVAVIQRASWKDEKYVLGTLDDIAEKVKEANITKTAQILVGDFINSNYEESFLYNKNFSHGYRKAENENSTD
ncbi:precorrin-4 C(11)-methyltransferase [Clostridium sp. cel8]|jgi:precorrin-4/cobalt-precorrin-4 C11-methyltransferase|uniref:precorrin-4 C(11)-methyltransferase n=1 Tax=Clostridium sp. cel8 TaxID=2663123 RepID=UPI0015F58164|nr:precorrin-4 C(11)-methyltransferase [Clostridium sp. cel8]MBA5850981.1 precorrin-4 C(11)-methyltransferase [Clostridium sp. cel8]